MHLKDKEGSLIDKRVADEVAKYAKLETEFKLLKREHSKTEIRLKTLQRDLLRMQAHSSSNTDATTALQAEKQYLLERISTIGYEKEEMSANLTELSRKMNTNQNEMDSLRENNKELTARNIELTEELAELRKAQIISTDGNSHLPESVTIGVNTDLQFYASSSYHTKPFNEDSTAPTINTTVAPSSKEFYGQLKPDTLESNILRLTRLADALLGRDE